MLMGAYVLKRASFSWHGECRGRLLELLATFKYAETLTGLMILYISSFRIDL